MIGVAEQDLVFLTDHEDHEFVTKEILFRDALDVFLANGLDPGTILLPVIRLFGLTE
jgi:hypothetical protein